jgi:glutamyl-tRNA reductase
VALYDMDDLQRTVARNLGGREAEAELARELVAENVASFERWLQSLDVVPTIAALREQGDQVVEHVLRENEPRWEALSDADRKRVEALARSIVSRLLHEPTLRLKDSVGDDSSYRYVHALRELFGLPNGEEEAAAEVTQLEPHRARRRRSSS